MKFTNRLRTSRSILSLVCATLLILTQLPLLPSSTVKAFIPTNLKALGGLLGKSHVKMTDEAITELDQEFFSVSNLTKSMKKAKEQIADANAEVDEDQKTASKHVDGESLPESQARIIDRLNGVILALNNENAEGLRSECVTLALGPGPSFPAARVFPSG